jgi:hypothetical protein
MRTKALLGAAILAAGLATSMAQNVYSLNVVGYYNVTIPANGFAMVANQLVTTNQTLGGVLPTAPDGTLFIKWDGLAYSTANYDELEPGWLPAGAPARSFDLGEGAFIKNVTASPMTITFVGEVKQGATTNGLPAGFSIESLNTPQAGAITSFNYPVEDGALLIQWDKTTQGYKTFNYDELEPGWLPAPGPSVQVGDAFWSKRAAAANWERNFTVPQ